MAQLDTKSDEKADNSPVVVFTDSNFQSEVLDAEGFVLVDFWAEWCGPCHTLYPHVLEVANDWQGKVKVGKLDVDENRETGANYGILSIPTMIVFKDGEKVGQDVGVKSADDIKKWIMSFGFSE